MHRQRRTRNVAAPKNTAVRRAAPLRQKALQAEEPSPKVSGLTLSIERRIVRNGRRPPIKPMSAEEAALRIDNSTSSNSWSSEIRGPTESPLIQAPGRRFRPDCSGMLTGAVRGAH